MALRRLGMGLDQDARAGIVLLRPVKRLAKRIRIGAAVFHRCIATCLVDHQHISRLRRLQVGIDGEILGQMRLAQPLDPAPRPVQQGGIVQRMIGQQVFDIRRLRRIEMHAPRVDHQPQWRLARPPGEKRPQERVLDPHDPRARRLGHRLAPRGIGRPAPDRDQVVGAGFAQGQFVPRQPDNPAHLPLLQETCVEIVKPPGTFRPDGLLFIRNAHRMPQPPPRVETPELTVPTDPSVPVMAEIVLFHWVNGASVT